MAAIVEVNGERRLQMGAEEFVRSFNFGARWTKIRIGMTLGFNGIANCSGNFQLGVCSGTDGLLAPTSGSYYGFQPTVAWQAAQTWTYTSGLYFNNASSNGYWIVKRGSTFTDTNAVGTGYYQGWAPYALSWFSIVLTRTSWNVINGKSSHASNTAQISQPLTDWYFYKNMENEGTAGLWGSADDSHNRTEPANALLDPLDNVSFSWNRSCPTLEIGNIGVVRFA